MSEQTAAATPTNFISFPGQALPILQRIDTNLQALMKSEASADASILAGLQEILDWPGFSPGVPTSVEICVVRYSPLKGGPEMAGTVTMTDDHVAHIPVKWTDDVGAVHAPSDAMAVSSDTAVATVALSSDMNDVDVTPVADGTVTVTVSSTSRNLSDMATVTIGAPAASAVMVDAADVTFTPKP